MALPGQQSRNTVSNNRSPFQTGGRSTVFSGPGGQTPARRSGGSRNRRDTSTTETNEENMTPVPVNVQLQSEQKAIEARTLLRQNVENQQNAQQSEQSYALFTGPRVSGNPFEQQGRQDLRSSVKETSGFYETRQQREQSYQREFFRNQLKGFSSATPEEQIRIASDPNSGFIGMSTSSGTSFTFTPTKAQIDQSKALASERFSTLPSAEKLELTRAGIRTSIYNFVPQTIIGTGDILQIGAQMGARDAQGKLIIPFSGRGEFNSVTEKLVRKIPAYRDSLDIPSSKITTGALIVGSAALGIGSGVRGFSSLRSAGYTRGEALIETAGAFSPFKIRDNTFAPNINKIEFTDSLKQIRSGDYTFSSGKSVSNFPGINSESFIISKNTPSGTSVISGLGESRSIGLQRRGTNFYEIEQTTQFTVSGKGKPFTIGSSKNSISNINVDPFRIQTNIRGPKGNTIFQSVDFLNPQSRVITRGQEIGLTTRDFGKFTLEGFSPTSKSIATNLQTGKKTSSLSTFGQGGRIDFGDLGSLGKGGVNVPSGSKTTIFPPSGTKTSLSSTFGIQRQSFPTSLPVIRPTAPKLPLTSVVVKPQAFPTIVGGSGARSAFAGTGTYELQSFEAPRITGRMVSSQFNAPFFPSTSTTYNPLFIAPVGSSFETLQSRNSFFPPVTVSRGGGRSRSTAGLASGTGLGLGLGTGITQAQTQASGSAFRTDFIQPSFSTPSARGRATDFFGDFPFYPALGLPSLGGSAEGGRRKKGKKSPFDIAPGFSSIVTGTTISSPLKVSRTFGVSPFATRGLPTFKTGSYFKLTDI